MTVGATQLFDAAFDAVLSANAGTQWDDATLDSFAFILVKSTHTPLDTDTTVADLGVAGTDWIETGDGAPIESTTRVVTQTGADTFYDSADANYGASVTVTAKYLVCIKGDKDLVLSTDKLIFWIDMETGGGSVSSTNSTFNLQAPTNGWFKTAQA